MAMEIIERYILLKLTLQGETMNRLCCKEMMCEVHLKSIAVENEIYSLGL